MQYTLDPKAKRTVTVQQHNCCTNSFVLFFNHFARFASRFKHVELNNRITRLHMNSHSSVWHIPKWFIDGIDCYLLIWSMHIAYKSYIFYTNNSRSSFFLLVCLYTHTNFDIGIKPDDCGIYYVLAYPMSNNN